jgi:hypothetical protein
VGFYAVFSCRPGFCIYCVPNFAGNGGEQDAENISAQKTETEQEMRFPRPYADIRWPEGFGSQKG